MDTDPHCTLSHILSLLTLRYFFTTLISSHLRWFGTFSHFPNKTRVKELCVLIAGTVDDILTHTNRRSRDKVKLQLSAVQQNSFQSSVLCVKKRAWCAKLSSRNAFWCVALSFPPSRCYVGEALRLHSSKTFFCFCEPVSGVCWRVKYKAWRSVLHVGWTRQTYRTPKERLVYLF